MKPLLEKNLSAYLDRTTGLKINLAPSRLANVPFFLRERYDLAEGDFHGRQHLFFSPRRDFQDWTPSVIQSDLEQLGKIFHCPLIFVAERIRPNQRHRLIRLRIPFIVPGTQMYLPDLMVDLREHFANQRARPVETLSPSAQHLFLMAIEQRADRLGNAHSVAEKVGYSAMTVGRAMGELEAVGLARIIQTGKTKSLALGIDNEVVNWRSLWERAVPHLRSPVRRPFPYIECPPELLAQAQMGGLSALAHYSMLNEPEKQAWVIGFEWFRKNAVAFENVEALGADWGKESLEIWSYDPGLSGTGDSSWIRGSSGGRRGIVDRLSLYLALRESKDERVEQALEQMIDDIPW